MYGQRIPKGLSSTMQAKYLTDPRLAMAAELAKSGSSTAPVSSPLEGLARMLQGGVAGYQQNQLENEYKTRGKEYSDALMNVQANPKIQTGVPALNDPTTGEQLVPPVAPGMDTMAAILRSGKNADNPDLQEYAQQLAGKSIENKADLENKVALETDPRILRAKQAVAAAGATRINMGAQEKEEDKAVGKAFGEDYVSLQKSGREAPGKIAKYDRLNSLLDGIDTGTFKGTTTDLKAAAKSAGMDLGAMGIKDDVAPIQAAQALTNAMALELRNPSGGAGMPGALSDADRVYLQSMTPGVEKTKEGRKLMTETATKLAKRDAEIAQLARNYRSKNGKLDEGFYDVLAQYSTQNPLFDPTKTMSPQVPGNRPPLTNFMK